VSVTTDCRIAVRVVFPEPGRPTMPQIHGCDTFAHAAITRANGRWRFHSSLNSAVNPRAGNSSATRLKSSSRDETEWSIRSPAHATSRRSVPIAVWHRCARSPAVMALPVRALSRISSRRSLTFNPDPPAKLQRSKSGPMLICTPESYPGNHEPSSQ